ncbi:YHS domain-containing protein [Cupriavidus sp. KK10]|jgi:Cu+-exporting ATPase|uniref:YHS domain-containing protein n=1 Tax=Cupriavidus sp. KK10 TaxID=1478019 RepID=UPI0020129C0B|nr:YHS domain-containing protein [Cupriavidus sp. KK10]
MPTKSTTPNGRNYGITDAQAVPTAAAGPAAPQQLVRDPVCGMEISPQEAAASTEVDQKRYWFCSPHCEQALLANPAKYILPLLNFKWVVSWRVSGKEQHERCIANCLKQPLA